ELSGKEQERAQLDTAEQPHERTLEATYDRLQSGIVREGTSSGRPKVQDPSILLPKAEHESSGVLGFRATPTHRARRICDLVFEDRHRRYSWSATTDMTSSSVVSPRITRRSPASRRLSIPLSAAYLRI